MCMGLRLLRTLRAPTSTCNIPHSTHLSKKHVSSVVYYRTMLSGPSAWRRLQAWPVPHASGHCLLPCWCSMLLQTHWLCGNASRRTWQKTSCIKHNRLVLSSARVWLCMSACLAALHVVCAQCSLCCVCSYNVQGEPARQLDVGIRDMVLQELALQLAHLNSSQGLVAFGLSTPAAQPVSVVVADEITRYDATTQAAMRDEHVPQLNPEQRAVYDNVMAIVDRRAFFVDGLGGTSKTFLYSCLLSTVHAQGRVAVVVASSGIVALLLDGGSLRV